MSKTIGELEYIGQRYGFKARALSALDVAQMSADELDWHDKFNTDALKAAIAEPETKAAAEREQIEKETARILDGGATPADVAAILKVANKFSKTYPQFIECTENTSAIVDRLKKNRLLLTFENFVSAFESLAIEGKLILDPSKIGAGTETSVTGYQLKRHLNLPELLKPAPSEAEKERRRVAKLSADQFKKETPELQNNELSPRQVFDIGQEINTFLSTNPEYVSSESAKAKMLSYLSENELPITAPALKEAFQFLRLTGEIEVNADTKQTYNATTFVAREGEYPGHPPTPSKYSFRKKLEGLSSDQFRERVRQDKTFRDAIERLG